jgi:hypothetical protein
VRSLASQIVGFSVRSANSLYHAVSRRKSAGFVISRSVIANSRFFLRDVKQKAEISAQSARGSTRLDLGTTPARLRTKVWVDRGRPIWVQGTTATGASFPFPLAPAEVG